MVSITQTYIVISLTYTNNVACCLQWLLLVHHEPHYLLPTKNFLHQLLLFLY